MKRLGLLRGMASYWLGRLKGNRPMHRQTYYVRKPGAGWMLTTEMFYHACLSAMDVDPNRYEGWRVCRVMSGEAVTV